MKNRSIFFSGIPALFLAIACFSMVFSDNSSTSVNAGNNVQTDMSSVALLSNESIDESKIIYDDFSGITLNQNWVVSHRKWGYNDNKGVSAKNVYLDTANDKVIIKALGNQHVSTPTVNGVGGPISGGALVLKEAARPGRYETRFKAAYNVGVCNAMWTYTENGSGENHEIDIEFPVKDSNGNNSFDEVIFTNYIGESNYQQSHSTLDYYLNDGEYHTYAIDWYYSANHKEIRYYIDSHLLATHTNISKLPFLASRLWLGCWLPNNEGFVGLPNFDECFMEIDYFKYSPFANQLSETQGYAPGCGETSMEYNILDNPFDKYNWLSNGSFNSISSANTMQARGYITLGTVNLYGSFDHEGKANSGGVKIGSNSSITYHIDSTYRNYKYIFSTYYKGEGAVSFSFYNKTDNQIKRLDLVLPYKDSWTKVTYSYEVPLGSFYTLYNASTSTSDLYLDDMFIVFGEETTPIEEVILLSISISGPNKTSYKIGEPLDLTGLVVTGIYSDGSSHEITEYQVSSVDTSTAGTKTITVTVGDLTATFSIIVDEEGQSSAVLNGISLEGQYKTEYFVGEALDFSCLVVKAMFSDGTTKVITDYDIYKPSTATVGKKRVTVTYIDQTASFEIIVKEVPKEEEEDKPEEPKKEQTICGGNILATGYILFALSTLGLTTVGIIRRFY